MTQQAVVDTYPGELKALLALVDKTDTVKPKAKDREALRTFLDTHPELWSFVGDLTEQAILNLISNPAGQPMPAAMVESLRAGNRQFMIELARPGDGALERLLIQQIYLCWLRLGLLEFRYTHITSKEHTYKEGQHLERRMNAAQQRFTRSVETLARVRKLALPAVQVNIASQQVNQVNR